MKHPDKVEMKKIFLISFYFSPCTLTPSQRITYWAKNFHKIGLYPIVITREWNENIASHSDTKIPLDNKIRHEIHENYDVYYLPFQPGILDKAYLKWGENSMRPLFLLVKILDVLLAFFTLKFSSYANFFPFLKVLQKQNEVDKLIISGEPFYLFKVGYLASRKLGLKWVADYRDDWSTNEIQRQKGNSSLRNLILKLESHYERKWVGTATYITSVSEVYTKRLSMFLGIPGITVANGFDEELSELFKPPLYKKFTIVYSGTLYPSQDIDIILEALRICVQKDQPFQLIFLGSGFDIKEKKRIESMVDKSLQPYVEVTTRLPRHKAINVLQRAHVLLGISYGSLKGIPTSKLYEYIGLKKPVLLCPSDHDVMEEMLKDVELGFFSDTPQECVREIETLKTLYSGEKIEMLNQKTDLKIKSYSRFHQMAKLKFLVND